MNYEEIIDGYMELREKCYKLAKKDHGKLMGDDYWLRFALMESDISLEIRESGMRASDSSFLSMNLKESSGTRY
jgi:hypothetical protein